MAENTSWYNRGLRPGASMIAEGESGSPGDPAQMIHEMKTAARKAAEAPTPPEPEAEPAQVAAGMYEGAGGYQYEVSPQGAVTIIKAPKGRGVGVVLTQGMAYDAILEELKDAAPGVPDLAEGGLAMDTRRTKSAEFDDIPGMDYPEPGVVAGVGPSGKELERVQGKGSKVAMGAEAQDAFDRTKAKTAKFSS